MGSMLKVLQGRKTYLLVIVYAVLVMSGFMEPDESAVSTGERLQDVVLAGGLATLRAGVAKVTG